MFLTKCTVTIYTWIKVFCRLTDFRQPSSVNVNNETDELSRSLIVAKKKDWKIVEKT